MKTEKNKVHEIYRILCDENGEACFSQKSVYKWAKPQEVCVKKQSIEWKLSDSQIVEASVPQVKVNNYDFLKYPLY